MKTQEQKPIRHDMARLFQVYLVLAGLAFATLFFLARSTPYLAFDVPISHAVQSISFPGFQELMILLTQLGLAPLAYFWCGAIVLVLFLAGLRWEAAMAGFAAAGVSLLGEGVKLVVHRARPTSDLVHVFSVMKDSGFPSGHVLFFTAFLGFLIFLLYTLAPRSWWRTVGVILLAIPIVLISVSRVYLGQHWPSDTLGAYLLASLWLTLMIYVYRRGKGRKFFERTGK